MTKEDREKVSAGPIELRPVSEGDQEFLADLFSAVRSAQFALSGLDADQIGGLLKMQFEFQQKSYLMQFPDAEHSIIQIEGESVGRMIVNRTGTELRLVDISILPEFRNLGKGTELISALIKEARGQNKKVALHVATDNPAAHRLYTKLGFRETGADELYISMEWTKERPDPSK